MTNVSYVSCFPTMTESFEQREYSIDIPENYKKNNLDYVLEYKEEVYEYNDNMKLYIIDSGWNYSVLNYENKKSIGIDKVKRKLIDTIYLSGQQIDRRYWRENILDDITIGYVNIPKQHKAKFDTAIESLTLVKAKKCK